MPIKVLSEVGEEITQNIMMHLQFADMMDFLGCHGFKRMAEYHFYKDCASLRMLHRYAINHCNKMLVERDVPTPKVIPSSWEGVTRQQVDENTRKKYVRQLILMWLEREKEMRTKLTQKYKEIFDAGYFHAAQHLECLINENEEEIKRMERKVIEYSAVDWNMLYLMQQQQEMHDCYKEKTEKIFE